MSKIKLNNQCLNKILGKFSKDTSGVFENKIVIGTGSSVIDIGQLKLDMSAEVSFKDMTVDVEHLGYDGKNIEIDFSVK